MGICHNNSFDLKGTTFVFVITEMFLVCLVVCLLILRLMKSVNLLIPFPPSLLLINKIDGYLANITSLQSKVIRLASFKQVLHHA